MIVKFKKLSEDAIAPRKAHHDDAAFDLFTPRTIEITQRRTKIELDLAIELPEGYAAEIFPRSGNTLKGIVFTSYPNGGCKYRTIADVKYGLIDAGYRGNIGVTLDVSSVSINSSVRGCYLPKGTKIAQMVIRKVESPIFVEVDELSPSLRGENGFGSTDKNK